MTIATGQFTITDFNDINISNTEPISPVLDMLWLDTSATPYTLKSWNGAAWVASRALSLAELDAIQDAKLNTRITTFYQPTVPTSTAVGDFWVDTSNNNHLYRAECIGADEIADGEWVSARDNSAVEELEEFVDSIYTPDIANLQTQIDGKIETYFQETDPNTWEEEDRAKHNGDMWFNTTVGSKELKRYNGTLNSWELIEDQKAIDAYTAASTAQDTADGKRRVFTVTPTPPYDVGDLWTEGSAGDLKRCKTAKDSEGVYSASDWELATKYDSPLSTTTYIIADYDTSNNIERADYVVPSGSTSAQEVINQAINDLPWEIVHSGTVQSMGGDSKTVIIDATADFQDNECTNYLMEIIDGTGVGQTQAIDTYTNSTTTIVTYNDWSTSLDDTSEYVIKIKKGSICLLEGIYIIDDSIEVPSGVLIGGQGAGSIIKIKDNFNLLNTNAINLSLSSNVIIKDLKINGNKNNSLSSAWCGIRGGNATNCVIKDCTIVNFGVSGIYMSSYSLGGSVYTNYGRNIIIQNNNCSYNNNSGILCYANSSFIINNICEYNLEYGINSKNSSVIGNICNYNGSSPFGGGITNGNSTDTDFNIITNNNTCNYNLRGISLSGDSLLVSNNVCCFNDNNGIILTNVTNSVINNNVVSSNSQSSDLGYSNILLTTVLSAYTSDNTIQNNIVRKGSETNKPSYGIEIANTDCQYNMVINNDLYTSGESGSLSDSGSGTVTTAGNRL